MRRKVMAMVMAAMTMAAAMAVPAMADEESVTIGISPVRRARFSGQLPGRFSGRFKRSRL